MRLGWNGGEGGRTAHCGLCDWTAECDDLGEIESRLARHLLEDHGRRLAFRRDVATGEISMVLGRGDGAA